MAEPDDPVDPDEADVPRPVFGGRFVLSLVSASLVTLVSLVGVAIWTGSSQVIRPPGPGLRTPVEGLAPLDSDEARRAALGGKIHDPQTDLGLAYADVSFPAADGSTLRGWLVPAPAGAPGANVAVITVHGAGGDRREGLRHAAVLNAAGHPVLLFDCREHGVSDGAGRGVSLGARESEDVTSAAAWLRRERGAQRVVALGIGQGADAAILAAARDRSLDAVVAEGATTRTEDLVLDTAAGRVPDAVARLVARLARWRGGASASPEPIDVVAQVAPAPLVLVHDELDARVARQRADALFARAAEPRELWIVPGAGGGGAIDAQPDAWRERVLGLLARVAAGS